jgi:hypothetical protein
LTGVSKKILKVFDDIAYALVRSFQWSEPDNIEFILPTFQKARVE